MKQKTIYLSGPITGLPENNYKGFALAQERLESLGHKVLNPHEFFEGSNTRDWTHDDFMRICIAEMMKADEVVTLPGWEHSKGAMIEVKIARLMFMDITNYIVMFKPETYNTPDNAAHN